MKKLILFFILTLIFLNYSFGQRNCGSYELLQQQILENPQLLQNIQEIEQHSQNHVMTASPMSESQVYTIPVVFHIVYKNQTENVSDAQIMSQLDVLNKDFSALNTDFGSVPSIFQPVAADAGIQFCLATRDPNGNPTTGIVRKSTTRPSFFVGGTSLFSDATGGSTIWNRNQYLNIYVCELEGGVLGYAQFPGGSSSTDAVVITYTAFGSIGTAQYPYDKGRTATHEVGHWLNLIHIWGDATCGSDLVSDTPVHNTSNGGCPTYPHYSTCSGTPIEMTMNYMDYTDDRCMYMFSEGQKSRMRAVLEGGFRTSLVNSPGCNTAGTTCNVPTQLIVSSIQQTSAICSWVTVSGATSYTVEYKLSTASTWISQNTSNTFITLTGLSSNSTYNVRVRANCSSGSSNFSTIVNFTTLTVTCTDTYEPNNNFSQAITISTGTSINASISSSNDIDWFKFTNTTLNKNIRVSLTNIPNDFDVKLYRGKRLVGTSENASTQNESIIFNNIEPGTTYYIKIYGHNNSTSSSCYTLLSEISSSNYNP